MSPANVALHHGVAVTLPRVLLVAAAVVAGVVGLVPLLSGLVLEDLGASPGADLVAATFVSAAVLAGVSAWRPAWLWVALLLVAVGLTVVFRGMHVPGRSAPNRA